MEQEIQIHAQRAQDELRIGLSSKVMPAARAHLELASMHFLRVRDLSQERCKPLLEM